MSAPVPFVDLERIHTPLRPELDAAMSGVASRGDFILGEHVERFEAAFAASVGTEFAIGVNSGTAAVAIGLAAAGIGSGDEVIVPAHTYIASALAVLHAGATPVFSDVDDATGLLALDSAAEVVGPRTAAVMAVHLYGQACAMDEVLEFADRHGLAVIEDAAQAHGARWKQGHVGGFGTVSAFSFYPSKNLGVFGDAGIVCTRDPEVAATARRLRNLGQSTKGDHALAGFNERLDSIQAAVLGVKLPYLEGWNHSRREAAALYRRGLPTHIALIPDREGSFDVHHLFAIRTSERDRLAAALAEREIATGIHYRPAVHLQPPFANEPPRTSLAVAEHWAATELSLPMFAGITANEVERVCAAVAEAEPAAAESVAHGPAI